MTDQDVNDWNDGVDPRIPVYNGDDFPGSEAGLPIRVNYHTPVVGSDFAEPLVTDDGAHDFYPSTPFEAEVLNRLTAIEETQEALKEGTNTIGTMMNGVSEAFGQIMTQIQKGGIGALLGGMMGKKE